MFCKLVVECFGLILSTPSPLRLQAGFRPIAVPWDAAQDFIADHVLIAEFQNRPAFLQERFAGLRFLFGGKAAEGSAGAFRLGTFHLKKVVLIFGAQALPRVGFRWIAFRDFIEPGPGGLIGFEPGFAFFFYDSSRRRSKAR